MSPLHDALHDEGSAAHSALRDAQRSREDAEDAATTAQAERARAEENFENAIREVDAEARKLDRKDPAIAARRTIFPSGTMPLIRPDGQAQLDVLPALRVRIEPFLGKGDMDAAKAGLDAAEALLRAALTTEITADAAVDEAFAKERAARRIVREQLETAYGRLREHYKAAPSAAEPFFFRSKDSTRDKSASAKAEAAMPAPATA